MKTRIISGLVLTPLVIGIVGVGGIVLNVVCMALTITALFELYRAINKKNEPENYISYLFVVIFFIIAYFGKYFLIIYLIPVYMCANLVFLVANNQKVDINKISVNVFGFIYLVFAFMSIFYIRESNLGFFKIWPVFICAFGTDVFAYFCGKAFGKTKLAPVLSPNKTIEGSIGGTLCSTIIFLIYVYLVVEYREFSHTSLLYVEVVIVGVITAIMAQFGDLSASAIKRSTGIKDYGDLIPGHGGIMDRFDSVIFTAPMFMIGYAFLAMVI